MRSLPRLTLAATAAAMLLVAGCAAEPRPTPFDGLTAEQHRMVGQFALELLSHGRHGPTYHPHAPGHRGIGGADWANRVRRYAESLPRHEAEPVDQPEEEYLFVDAGR